ncbi:MAG: Isoleucine--tRNA ligase [Bacteroidetes bacterium ADurb.Bin408]|nr:MAG: Isoleucine--tRNA ligase [Bacteroidetes bacterium ADurb.Bin408]
MKRKYNEYKQLNLSLISREIRQYWESENIFEKSVEMRKGHTPYVFYEGPPSANGKPGIHHVMARAIKDIFCRYKTQKGCLVERKGGWDTHGLPVEIGVEKALGITKEDIGKKISIAEYNNACRKDVMKFKSEWDEITRMMGYWVDLENPYITFENNYIETLWYLLKKLYDKGLLYKGYTIQPYSPAAGTGLSTHELNQPGCYKMVKDTTVVAQFKVIRNERSEFLFKATDTPVYFLAWTTTPWTLPSNTGLAVGAGINYSLVRTFNPYTFKPITVVLAEDLLGTYFPEKNAGLNVEDYKDGDKNIPFKLLGSYKGKDFENIRYEQLLPYAQPEEGDPFRVVIGDFVTTEDGTGIVHIAPSFGADDFRVGRQYGLGALTMVDKQGKFTAEMGEFAHRFVKVEYDPGHNPETDNSVDVDIVIKLKKENKAFKAEKYEHSYPHCWRTDKPVLYYPLDSWFIKTTAMKDRMIELNKTINWKPESTGTGRFGNWLENLVDWNLSRSRYWGTPLPIWVDESREHIICIGSIEELKNEAYKAIERGLYGFDYLKNIISKYETVFTGEELADFGARIACITEKQDATGLKKLACKVVDFLLRDLHRPYVDDIILTASNGAPMRREPDLIDVWFDSGAMPYAQWHYPFEKKEFVDNHIAFPADFIAEGVDQTRGWFFTLHALAVMLFDSVAFKTVVSNGLVLDKEGNKMSKRLGNAVDPFLAIEKYGPDAVRWYMITNAQPWDNLKFDWTIIEKSSLDKSSENEREWLETTDENGKVWMHRSDSIIDVQRKFFGTLYNTYAFFALYANIDGFCYEEPDIPLNQRTEIDRWIISELNTLIKEVDNSYAQYEPTRAGRLIQNFVDEFLSNWYVRLCRRRFWKGEYSDDKIAAYQTLYTCLDVIARLSAPIAPFFMEKLFRDLNQVTRQHTADSVHLADFPVCNETLIDKALEERMQMAQKFSSMVLSLRKKHNIRVRQPLNKILIPVLNPVFEEQLRKVESLILSEVNVKNAEYLYDTTGFIVKKIKPNFKTLGPRYGKIMKQIAAAIQSFGNNEIGIIERENTYGFVCENQQVVLTQEDVVISTEDVPGWLVTSMNGLTVALDTTITPELKEEGIAREIINRIQNLRKEKGFEVTDKINVAIQHHDEINSAIHNNISYICAEILADDIQIVECIQQESADEVEVIDNLTTKIVIERK